MALIPLGIRVDPRQTWFSWPTDQESRVFRVRVNYKKFSAAATTGDVDIPMPGGLIVEKAWISLIAVFAGGGVGSSTLSIGLTTAIATYQAALNVFTGQAAAGAVTQGAAAGLGTFIGGNATPTAAAIVRLRLTVDTTTAVLTAGTADVYMQLRAISVKST